MMPKPVGLPWNHDNVSSNLIVYWMFEILYRFRCIKNGAKHFWRKIPWDEKQPFEMGMRFALDIFHVPWTFSYRCSTLFLASNQHTNRRRWKKERYWFQLLYGTGWGYMALRVSALVFEMKEANGRTTEKNAALTPSNQNCSVRHSNIWIVVVIVLANISVFGRFPFSLFHMSLFVCRFF